ncbi:hypothetical protein ABWK26_27290 [Bacillus toyonensis]|uniref:Sigma-O factor regulatory protein RsoA n=2 Tax=Bacillus toyonensis TaxID=155322 RepID=A0AB73S3V3_9BACI|nr:MULTISPECIES: hypothetical protein [Bacillus]EOP29615.1 hypothetical protein IIS_05293 [Bacillus cereus VD131]OTX13863.1 hypothetical protein BK712_01215 [Bacillus thuringiensis serovar seoulensis]KAF6547533.1 hypothetical protein G9F74_27505 [Bacillus sp. EKM202B]MBJ8043357.1 hypothetical protein [Bacillus cereus group sp. N17]MBJ8068085.1 hypothetical protein [Bacillus cereus group sp. N15]
MIELNNQNLNSCNYEEILRIFKFKICSCLQNTPYQEREDLEQEIKMKIFEKIDVINTLEVPGFFEFLDCSTNN